MCGIAGIWWNQVTEVKPHYIKKMTDTLSHRGPDAEGQWTNEQGLYLGHRRLSILDLDPRSNQPFQFMDRYIITFNGEIYNFIELKHELEKVGFVFRTTSDTEVICAAFHHWKTDCLKYFDGMFAFALYDTVEETLFCARDRFGEKPFYYAFNEKGFYFASEMKALWEAGIQKNMRREMMFHFLAHDLVEDVSTPECTFYDGIFRLKASHCLVLRRGEKPIQKSYYYPRIDTTFTGNFAEATEQFRQLFNQSIQRRMRADVSVGSSLSGGMDSSAVTAIMHQYKQQNFTFSARFPGFEKDEGEFIDRVSSHYNTHHFNCFPDENGFVDKLNRLIYHQEEPFQTGSIFAQFEVYELARKQNCLVLLDGQGADELLGGYFNYLLPYFFELKSGEEQQKFASTIYGNQGIQLEPSFKQKIQFEYPRMHSFAGKMKTTLFKRQMMGINQDLVKENKYSQPFKTFPSLKESLRYSLTSQGLEKLLRFSDRNAMAHSIEVRLPFLNHELVDFVLSLPADYFFHSGWTKSILRNTVKDELPDEIVWRRDKVGFEAPHKKWIHLSVLTEMLDQAHMNLQKEGVITVGFEKNWKVLILSKMMEHEQ